MASCSFRRHPLSITSKLMEIQSNSKNFITDEYWQKGNFMIMWLGGSLKICIDTEAEVGFVLNPDNKKRPPGTSTITYYINRA